MNIFDYRVKYIRTALLSRALINNLIYFVFADYLLKISKMLKLF